MNVEKLNDDGTKYQLHFYEGYWNHKNDMLNNSYPNQKHYTKEWNGKYLFAKKLFKIQNSMTKQLEFNRIKISKCSLCGQDELGDKEYILKRRHWTDDLIHNIVVHNYEPSLDFIEFILGHYVGIVSDNKIRLPSLSYTNNQVKIDRNQLQILDSLMKNGGYTKKYQDKDNKLKYSEHAGLLIFDDNTLDKIVISGDSTRNNQSDPDILLPLTLKEAFDCEYIFHTHPPTPTPGARMKENVFFELPSPSDITHFIEHSVLGITKGSLVITPEGLYNIRILNPKKKKYMFKDKTELDKLKSNIFKVERKIQNINAKVPKSIDEFHKIIRKYPKFITPLNNFLSKYNVHVDFYPRKQNENGLWIIDSVFLK